MSSAKMNLFWLIVFGATLPIGVVLSTHLARRSFEKVKLRDQTITAKGYAEQPIQADLARWSAVIIARDKEVVAANATLKAGRDELMAFLAEHDFAAERVSLSSVRIDVLHPRDKEGYETNEIEGYSLAQSFTIESAKVQDVARAARDASVLIEKGIELSSGEPVFLHTGLNSMKLQMIGQATQNARQRAEQLLAGSGNRLGPLRSASQGVFQITPPFSTEASGSGENDTSSIDKVIKAVVTVEYAIE